MFVVLTGCTIGVVSLHWCVQHVSHNMAICVMWCGPCTLFCVLCASSVLSNCPPVPKRQDSCVRNLSIFTAFVPWIGYGQSGQGHGAGWVQDRCYSVKQIGSSKIIHFWGRPWTIQDYLNTLSKRPVLRVQSMEFSGPPDIV